MKKLFKEYYKMQDFEYDFLWNNALFVFDTNIFLNLYRYSNSTRDAWFYILEKLKERLWIPYQIGWEYHENRLSVINEVECVYDKTEKLIKEYSDKIQREIKNMRYPSWEDADNSKILKAIETSFKDILLSISRDKEKQPKLRDNDFILKKISGLYENKVGSPYTDEQLKYVYKEGKTRYENSIPPGYMDKDKKSEREKYGDLIIWKQIIDYVLCVGKPIIFITDDVKEDWWTIVKHKNTGCRVELIKEFNDETEQLFYMYNSERFIQFIKKYFHISVDNKVMVEVKVLGKGKLPNLTEREIGVLKAVMEGYSNNEIAEKFSISTHTVKAHIASLFKKFSVCNSRDVSLKAEQLFLDKSDDIDDNGDLP